MTGWFFLALLQAPASVAPGTGAAGGPPATVADYPFGVKILALRLAAILAHARRPVELPRLTLRHGNSIDFQVMGRGCSDIR